MQYIFKDNRGTNASCTLNINPNGKSTVRITGDIYPEISQGGTDRVVNLNLANEQSYWAGDIDDEHLTEKKLNTNLKLSNGAVWYTGKDAYKINTESDDIFTIKSDSGIIDIYHSQPGEARQNKDSGRTFTVNDVDDDFSGANGTTFRIGSNIEAGLVG